MIFRDRLKELRVQTKLSQAQLSTRLGYGKSTLGAWELGRTQPGIEGLITLANYFNVTVDYLIGKSDFSVTPQHQNMMEVFPYERQVIKAYRALAPSQQEMVSRMLGIAYDMPISKEA